MLVISSLKLLSAINHKSPPTPQLPGDATWGRNGLRSGRLFRPSNCLADLKKGRRLNRLHVGVQGPGWKWNCKWNQGPPPSIIEIGSGPPPCHLNPCPSWDDWLRWPTWSNVLDEPKNINPSSTSHGTKRMLRFSSPTTSHLSYLSKSQQSDGVLAMGDPRYLPDLGRRFPGFYRYKMGGLRVSNGFFWV